MHRVVRILAAVLILAGAAVHLDLWRGGYKGIPSIGPLFLANVIASAVVAAALVVRGGRIVLLAGSVLAFGSLVALVLSRTVGLLGFMEGVWTVEAMRTVAAEVGALVAFGVVAASRGRGDQGILVPASALQA